MPCAPKMDELQTTAETSKAFPFQTPNTDWLSKDDKSYRLCDPLTLSLTIRSKIKTDQSVHIQLNNLIFKMDWHSFVH